MVVCPAFANPKINILNSFVEPKSFDQSFEIHNPIFECEIDKNYENLM